MQTLTDLEPRFRRRWWGSAPAMCQHAMRLAPFSQLWQGHRRAAIRGSLGWPLCALQQLL